MTDGGLAVEIPPAARLTIPLDRLTSGNQLYDAELGRRVEARRFPTAVIELRKASPIGSTGRYHIEGELTFHGMNRAMVGTVTVSSWPAVSMVAGVGLNPRPSGYEPADLRLHR